ncbi:tRNA (uracil-5-)-methyltransferase [Sulfurivirga caldicuralii]|uniref:tRNA/tmRNA (uracil-C(5))-methyltransferase n=1 Tax=Sulfurivirga caldicuralii TaxID=364032 RepID=A0A1N6HHC7_9GAMM|nr:tRNA (uridine(54)-C5)-methyltransferase TrmA [Sulfurivirga caldicuralii]SIO19162.1 tRNA (uracil-5-)-methyltransferase [Sulfurivirga caldicuralii]
MQLCQANPALYEAQLADKQARLSALLGVAPTDVRVFPSPLAHFRQRIEFRVWHEGDDSYYVMFPPGDPKNPQRIDTCTIAAEPIAELMEPLRQVILMELLLRRKLYQVDFLSTLSGEMLVTLIYHKPLDEEWIACAEVLKAHLPIDSIIGRSRKQKILLERDYVVERLEVDGHTFTYQQIENSFSQPNAQVARQMLGWARRCAEQVEAGDLLELYGGNGHFSIALAEYFPRVLMTEISGASIRSARWNLAANRVENIAVVKASAEQVSEALHQNAATLKQVPLRDYHFSTLLVDPPRAGLDELTRALAARFEHVIYISCNPETLARDLVTLRQSHEVVDVALFDQFPYTHHIESGVFLRRKA